MTMKTRIYFGEKDITDEHLDYLQDLKLKMNESNYTRDFVFFCLHPEIDFNVFDTFGLDKVLIDDKEHSEVGFNLNVFEITDEYLVSSYDWFGIVIKSIYKLKSGKHSFYLSDFTTFKVDEKIFLSIYGGYSEKEGCYKPLLTK